MMLAQPVAAEERSCWRPMFPVEADHANRQEYVIAREDYYAQATYYINCIDGWIADAEVRYRQMFEEEVRSYTEERQAVFEELRLNSRTR